MWFDAWLTITAYRDLPVTNKSRYFAKTEFNSVAKFVFLKWISATLTFSRKTTQEGEKRGFIYAWAEY